MERALHRANESVPDDRQDCLDALGVDFKFMSANKAIEVASWLSELVKGTFAEGKIGPNETDREHDE
jgi:hypothetical protein